MTFAFSHAILVGIATFLLMLPLPAMPAERVDLWSSIYVLFAHDGRTFRVACTTFPIDQDEKRTYFATASHCLNTRALAIAPELRNPRLLIARVEADNRGLDVAVLSVPINPSFVDVLPLGKDPRLGDEVLSVAYIHSQFRSQLSGTVASPVDPFSFHNTFDIHLSAPFLGSSGAPIFCVEQQAVCGIMSGYRANATSISVAAPISSLRGLKWKTEMFAKGDTDSTPL